MRDAFAVLFFVSIGLLFDPNSILEAPGLLAATLAIILIGKPLAALSIVLALGYPLAMALAVAVALAQIGEFSFILASLGRELGVLPEVAIDTLIAAAIVSIALNPLLYRTVDPLARWLVRHPRLARAFGRRPRKSPAATKAADDDDAQERSARHRAVVVGYGPVGRTVARLLRENDVEPTVIELNLEAAQKLRNRGIAAVYGDAAHRDTLKAAGVASAGTFILSVAGLPASEEIIRLARDLNPDIRVLVRGVYVGEMPRLSRAGADGVFTGEGEVALALTVAVLRELGATPEQIDREQERVRADLFGDTLHEGVAQQESKPTENVVSPPPETSATAEPEAEPPTVAPSNSPE
jgi:CPA2 family monovalent cation:H+ antiporter-2